ncbi:MAG: type II secretion system protein GspE, partial [Comamonadaceae bacterium]|nr:type II secretion system protein GspE [Comamonadaceae bacterium]
MVTDTLAAEAASQEPVAAPRPFLGELLVQAGKLTARDLERALSAQQEMGGMLGRVLVRLGLVSETDVVRTLSEQLGVPFVAADAFPDLMPEVPGLLPEFLQANAIYPLRQEGQELHVAMAVPQDAFLLKALHLVTGCTVKPHLALESDIEKALAEPAEEASAEDDDGFADGLDGGDFVEHLKDLASEAPVIRLVNTIIGRVTDLRASDIHLEPFDDGLHVRYRVDGVIHLGE